MKLHLPEWMCNRTSFQTQKNQSSLQVKITKAIMSLFAAFVCMHANAQGTWIPVKTPAPDPALGVMLLLSDGTVICKSSAGGTDGIGTVWDKLTPDSKGSYVNGTWTRIKPMINSRLYFSSQVLKDGRVYVAGGEYGTGGSASEVYDPVTNTWTANPAPGGFISDANSEILENGKVLQAIVQGNPFIRQVKIYDPATKTYANGPSCIGGHNESTWVKLPDNSILMVDIGSRNSERYIPALNQWIADATVPVDLYDIYGSETGAGLLLPNGKAFFIGATGHTAYYTPSGNNNPGTWTAGPDIPKGNGQTDAPAAMMVNGKILMTAAPKPTATGGVFRSPTTFWIFDYTKNTYQQISTPTGAISSNVPCYVTMMLDLPDGSVLFSYQDSSKFYIYKPTGSLPAQAKPVISTITKNTDNVTYTITGTLFNGISEGACYGDDWQMATNYPIARLTDATNGNVYYAKTYNWNSTGVRRAGKKDSSQFSLPAGLPQKTYQLQIIANGIASDPVSFTPGFTSQTQETSTFAFAKQTINGASVYPNPANGNTNLSFIITKTTNAYISIFDASGKHVKNIFAGKINAGEQLIKISTSGLNAGIYSVRIITDESYENLKLVVQ